jgi:S1-C subfamily serine protease
LRRWLGVALLALAACATTATDSEIRVALSRPRAASFSVVASTAVQGEPLSEFLRRRTAVVVGIPNIGPEKTTVQVGCAAVVATDGYLLTAKHVVEWGVYRVGVVTSDSSVALRWVDGRVVWNAPRSDLTLVAVDSSLTAAFAWTSVAALATGTKVVGTGLSQNDLEVASALLLSPYAGELTRTAPHDSGVTALDFVGPIFKGDSGSALATLEGGLLGVVVEGRWTVEGTDVLVDSSGGKALRPDVADLSSIIAADRAKKDRGER